MNSVDALGEGNKSLYAVSPDPFLHIAFGKGFS